MKLADTSVSAVKSEVFYDIPLVMMVVEGQIRSQIDQEEESFKALVASIGDKGLLEPVLVTPKDGKYLLISGERRFLACRQLCLPTIPARVLDAVEAKAEILAIQLMENLQREDLDPIDTANALLSFFQTRHDGMTSEAIMSALVTADRDPARADSSFAVSLTAMQNISGKSMPSLKRILSLLKLPQEVQKAVKEGALPVTQGYVFAANLDNPSLMEIFNTCLERPMTQAAVESKLAAAASGATTAKKTASTPLTKFYSSMKSIKISLTKSAENYRQTDLEKLRDDLKTLTYLVEQQILSAQPSAAAAETTATAKTKKKVLA